MWTRDPFQCVCFLYRGSLIKSETKMSAEAYHDCKRVTINFKVLSDMERQGVRGSSKSRMHLWIKIR